MYNPNTFISTFITTDKAITFLNSNNSKVITINVCNYNSCRLKENNLQIILTNDLVLNLPFINETAAKTALFNFINTIELLRINCVITPNINSDTAVNITYANLQLLQSTNDLVPLQLYLVSGCPFIDNPILYLRPYFSNDYILQGKNANSHPITVNIVNDLIISYIDSTNQNSFEFSNIAANNSTFIKAFNSSGTINNSNNIDVFNSTIDIDNVSELSIRNSNITATQNTLDKVIIENIDLDFDLLDPALSFTNVTISKNSKGKEGVISNPPTGINGTILQGYIDVMIQNFNITTESYEIFLAHPLANIDANINCEFNIIFESSTLIGNTNTITIKDFNTNNVLYIMNGVAGSHNITACYDKTTNSFIITNIFKEPYEQTLTVSSNGQTTISGLTFPVIYPEKFELYVNGVKCIYNDDYLISGLDIIWSGPYLLQNDKIHIKYY